MRPILLACVAMVAPAMAQPMRQPNLDVQRAAMKKLGFLIGKWAGEARILRPDGPVVLAQTEEAQFRLDGLILSIEGVGQNKADGKAELQAFAIVSYDDESGSYRMRAFNDGRFLETEMKLAGDGRGVTWGFSLGPVKTNSTMRISEQGDWTELTEISIGTNPPRKYMELRVSRKQ